MGPECAGVFGYDDDGFAIEALEAPTATDPAQPRELEADDVAELHEELVTLALSRESWHSDAACRGLDPDLFYPERGSSTSEAKEVCRGCIVRDQCQDYALANERFGIWGGTSERERRGVRKARAAAAAAEESA